MSKAVVKRGRPLKFKDPKELWEKAQATYEKWIEEGEPITITGFALELGFYSRRQLYEYGEMSEFSPYIKKIQMLVENAYEKRLHGGNPTGAIFALKNMGWIDKQEVEQVGKIIVEVRFDKDFNERGGATGAALEPVENHKQLGEPESH